MGAKSIGSVVKPGARYSPKQTPEVAHEAPTYLPSFFASKRHYSGEVKVPRLASEHPDEQVISPNLNP